MSSEPVSNALEGIAIIGMSGRFPGARNVDEFWKNLKEGIDSITFFSKEEARAAGINEADLNNPDYVFAGGILEDIEMFEPQFFGFNPRDAEIMDPQQRVFFECAYEALENAGYARSDYDFPIGIYAGTNISTYFLYHLLNQIGVKDDFPMAIGNDKDYLATRVSYALNLKGPSMSVQTACSTSMTAISMACEGLLNYHCDMALAGGVAIKLPQKMGYLYQTGMIVSPDGHTRTFDENAQGTVFTSAAGVILLKRLEDAIREGDHIYAVIKGIAINNDGSTKIGYTAPSREGQVEVIAAAQNLAGVNPVDISYIEAHGTGTSLGDPIELAALTQVFRRSTDKKAFCAIGSVKSNIGHAVSAAGVAGVIKTALALKHAEIPPSINFSTPNPKIDFANSPFYVNTTLTKWKSEGPRLAGVSSFGIGGTNIHAVMEEAPVLEASEESRVWQLLTLSARTKSALDTMCANLADFLRKEPGINFADAVYTLHVGRKECEYRRAIICKDAAKAVELLDSGGNEAVHSGITNSNELQVAFVFSGCTGADATYDLYEIEAEFRNAVNECDKIIKANLGLNLIEALYPGNGRHIGSEPCTKLNSAILKNITSFVIEYALARLWMSWGVKPQAVIGKGIGEYTAACISGVYSLENALMLVSSTDDMLALNIRKVNFSPLEIPYVSGATGTWLSEAEVYDRNYWAKPINQDMFNHGLQELKKDSERVLLLIGKPFQTEDIAKTKVIASFFTDSKPSSGIESMLTALGQLWIEGIKVDWNEFHKDGKRLRTPLPTYPFERKRYWVEQYNMSEYISSTAKPAGKESGCDSWLYFPSWKRSLSIPFDINNLNRDGCWLLFQDDTGFGSKLRDFLSNAGIDAITVTKTEYFKKINDNAYGINPRLKEDYRSLLEHLSKEDKVPVTILHLWSITLNNTDLSRLEFSELCQTNGFFSLLYLVQALGEQNIEENIRLAVISNNMHAISGEEYIHPEKATILGPCKVIPREYTKISCQSIDITLYQNDNVRELKTITMVLAELSVKKPEFIIALRGSHRWLQTFENVSIDDAEKTNWLKEGGTYLITGGLGGIGLAAADYMARKTKVKLVLTRRSAFPDKSDWNRWLKENGEDDRTSLKIRQLQALEKLGSEIMIINADITDFNKMKEAVNEINRLFGEINGVIHAAGIADNGLIQEKGTETAVKVLAPKVLGTLVLDELFKGKEPGFFVMFSSSSAVLGNAGFIDYCSANLFLDAYAHYYNSTGNSYVVSINWDEWDEVGMAAENKTKDRVRNKIQVEKGLKLLDDILSAKKFSQVIVSPGDFTAMIQDIRNFLHSSIDGTQTFSQTASGTYNRPDLETPYTAPENETEEAIAEIWRKLLGVQPVGVHDDFFDLGGHSLLATTLISELGKKFHKSISLQSIFEKSTVAQLAEMFIEDMDESSEYEYEEGLL